MFPVSKSEHADLRDVFATIASEAVCETANINLAVLYQAALSVFDEKLDTIGSGMVAVRQVISLYRHGFLEAAGAPMQLRGEHFERCSTPKREMARIYRDPEPTFPVSPRRHPVYGRPAARTRPRTTLEPLAHGSRAQPQSLKDDPRPNTYGARPRAPAQGDHGWQVRVRAQNLATCTQAVWTALRQMKTTTRSSDSTRTWERTMAAR